jgi:DNA-binding NarL/FixJ family response regulator
MKQSVRVLLIDDYAAFRDLLRTILERRPELEVVGEAASGLDGIEKAQALRPDLIVLDLGLPDIHGIEVTRRVQSLSPKPKILMVSANRSMEIVDEALRSGADGYVLKSDAQMELLHAVDLVLQGTQIVSTSLMSRGESSPARRESQRDTKSIPAPKQGTRSTLGCYHHAGFFSDDLKLLEETAAYIGNALRAGNAAIVIATEPHRMELLKRLWASGIHMDAATEEGRYVALDSARVLRQFTANGRVDAGRFMKTFSAILKASLSVRKRDPRVALFGECAPLLLARGNINAALQVERLCNELLHRYDVDILCGYSMDRIAGTMDALAYEEICQEHSMVYSR